jgi:hypothetical protein
LKAGDISCIKTLLSEIDGILRRTYVTETTSTGGLDKCVKLLKLKAEGKLSQPGSLLSSGAFHGRGASLA